MAEFVRCVKVAQVSTVYAAAPVQRSTHVLSNLDLIYDNDHFYAQLVFLFRAGIKSHEIPLAVESLKASASELLCFYPVLAGRLAKDKKDYNRTVVDVNNSGIPFYVGHCEARLSDWDELRHIDIDLELNPPNTGFDNSLMESQPLIRLQATFFQDGGLALGFSALHMLVDGGNAIDFMKSWGEIHRGLGQISKTPRFCGHLLRSTLLPDNVDAEQLQMPENVCFADAECQPLENVKRNVKRHIFKMTEEGVEKLILEVENGPYKYKRVSSYEAVSALFWKCITAARGDGRDCATHFTIPVSITRPGRFDPELPKGYFGNSVVMTLATSTTEKISSEHVSFAAKLVHEKSRSYVPELGKSMIDTLEMRLRKGKSLAISISEGRNLLSTSFTSFPVYEVEFSWGKVEQCIFSFPLDPEGLIATLPVPEGGRGRHVAVCLCQEHMQKLIEDPLFSKYCTL